MKNILYLLILLFSLPLNFNIAFAENNNCYYAKIENEAYFYSQPNDLDKLFQIPTSFFVLLIGEENNLFYKACYKDIFGFVKKSEVSPMSGEPTSPYPNANFRVFAKEGLKLCPSPSSSNEVAYVPYLCDSLEFYGYMTGDEDIPGKSNQWLYCKYQEKYGYLYSVFCDSLPAIEKNTEYFEIIKPNFSSDEILNTSQTPLLWIMLGVALPSIIVLFLLMKPSLIKEKILKGGNHSKKKDYFEFDDSSLN